MPGGFCFKGYPSFFPHIPANKIFAALLSAAVPADIIHSRGDRVNFALRVQTYAYPESVYAHWVLLAVRFIPVAA